MLVISSKDASRGRGRSGGAGAGTPGGSAGDLEVAQVLDAVEVEAVVYADAPLILRAQGRLRQQRLKLPNHCLTSSGILEPQGRLTKSTIVPCRWSRGQRYPSCVHKSRLLGTYCLMHPLENKEENNHHRPGFPARFFLVYQRYLPVPLQAAGPSRFLAADDDNDDDFNESSQSRLQFFSPSTGIIRVEDISPDIQIVEGQIELVGFSPTSSVQGLPAPPRMERTTPSPNIFDESASAAIPSSPRMESSSASPNMFDDDELIGITSDVDPGSDIENPSDEVLAGAAGNRRSLLEAEPLPSDLLLALDESDIRDDMALREVVSNPDLLNFQWTNDPETFVGQQEVFVDEARPTFTVDGLSPLEVFEHVWDYNIIQLIVRETNRYGLQLYAKSNKPWSDIDVNDIWAFFALIMLQSILILPVEKEYWYPCIASLKVGDFNQIMPLKKLIRIKRCLHFVDNSILTVAALEDCKLKKIWPIVSHLNDKFSSLYLPVQYIAIDESLLLWKGRLSFVQLIATKAARVKSYELCESRTGYLWKMLIYTGKGDKSKPASDAAIQDEPEGATFKIVYDLVRPLLGKGHTLVMDNFYNSPLLSLTLKEKRTDTMGTLRLKREFVPDALRNLSKSNMRVGEVIYSQTEDLTISVWHDANVVSLISTFHKPIVGGKEKYGSYKYKPQVVLDCNMTMGGVDKKDQMLQAFPVERIRNQAWYKKLFRRLFNVSIYNAFIMHNPTIKKESRGSSGWL